jgi:hypothetical protein
MANYGQLAGTDRYSRELPILSRSFVYAHSYWQIFMHAEMLFFRRILHVSSAFRSQMKISMTR